jgi:hypothetical protein
VILNTFLDVLCKLKNEKAVELTKLLVLRLLDINFTEEYSQQEYSMSSRTNGSKASLWRALCILSQVNSFYNLFIKLIKKSVSEELSNQIHQKVWKILNLSNFGNIRYLIQLFIMNILIHQSNGIYTHLIPLLR